MRQMQLCNGKWQNIKLAREWKTPKSTKGDKNRKYK
jgi:hypothetical protein